MASASTSTGYQVLREQLQGLRWRVGEPTYEQMGKLWPDRPAPMRGAVRVFAPSTIADNLNGHRRGMSFDFVRFFVLSCLAYAMDMGIELSSEDQRLDLWYQRWQAQRPARAAASATSLPTDAGLRLVMGGSGGPAASHGRASVGDNQTSVAGDGEQVAAATIGGGGLMRSIMAFTGPGRCPVRVSAERRINGDRSPVPTWMEQVLAGFVEVIEFDRVLRGSLGRRQCCCSVRWWIGHAGSGTRAGRG